VVVKGGRIILRGDGPGIKPILDAIGVLGDDLIGSAVADRVIGKAAALFLAEAGVRWVFGELLSEHAQDHLERSGIHVEGERVVEHIANRSRDDLCPLERIAVENDDPAVARERIRAFICGS